MPASTTQPVDLDSLDPAEWLTPDQAADALGVKVNTLRSWLRRGQGPAYYQLGRLHRLRAGDVTAWRDEQKREPV